MSKWYNSQGNNSDVVLTSKIRLARNLSSVPFPCRMTNDLRKSICKKIFATIQNSSYAGEFDLIELDKLSDIQKISLAERGLISTQMANQQQYSAVLISKDESISIMLCEEDHIRLSVMNSGQDLQKAYEKANKLDDMFISSLKIAFSERLGFLTSNPMHLGTGMKASVLLHLPAISEKGMLPTLRNMVSKLGFSIKAVFGDGSFYELSNEISLGITEKSAIENLNAICDQIVKQERACREALMEYDEFQDKIFRAMGTLKMARQLNSKEFYSLISLARLGIAMNIFDNNENTSYDVIGDMMHTLGTATIMTGGDENFTAEEANRLRAQYVREKLG
jgi:protein arginine kinase